MRPNADKSTRTQVEPSLRVNDDGHLCAQFSVRKTPWSRAARPAFVDPLDARIWSIGARQR
jgi:hypothetical protein